MLSQDSTLKYLVVEATQSCLKLDLYCSGLTTKIIGMSSIMKSPEFKATSDFVRQQGVSILRSIPERIMEISNPQERTEKLLEHIERFKNGVGSLKQAKFLIVGAGNAGKTSLCNCVMQRAKRDSRFLQEHVERRSESM